MWIDKTIVPNDKEMFKFMSKQLCNIDVRCYIYVNCKAYMSLHKKPTAKLSEVLFACPWNLNTQNDKSSGNDVGNETCTH